MRLRMLAAAAAMVAAAAPAGAAVVDFEGSAIPATFKIQGPIVDFNGGKALLLEGQSKLLWGVQTITPPEPYGDNYIKARISSLDLFSANGARVFSYFGFVDTADGKYRGQFVDLLPNVLYNFNPGDTGNTGFARIKAIRGSVLVDNAVYSEVTGYVPEPSTWAMMIGGVGMVGGVMRRRRSTQGYKPRPA